ncbi:MAG: phage baseplate protein [Desulfobacteraceae bacterium]|nr:phage baseplate protein [Desulfobacteraceae bacterium]
MNRRTGKAISGIPCLEQSIEDILSTRIGSRIMRKNYGSRIYDFIDAPINQVTTILIYAAIAEALFVWEPRIEILKIQASIKKPGQWTFDLTFNYLASGQKITSEGIEVSL